MYTVNKIETFRPAYRCRHGSSRVYFIFCLLVTGLFYLTAASNTANAATYYLDAVNGDDGNPGTDGAPWKTMNKAFNTATYGDTVLIRDGNYDAFSYSSFPVYTGSMTEPLPAGIEFITIKADTGHTPTFTNIRIGSTGTNQYVPYILDGLTIQTTGNALGLCLLSVVGTRVQNCVISGSSVWEGKGIDIPYSGGISNDIIIDNCTIHTYDRGIQTFASNLIIKNCDIYNIGEDHLNIASGTISGINTIIENNHIHHTNMANPMAHPDGIALTALNGVIIRNNILNDCSVDGIFNVGTAMHTTNVLIENNLIYRNLGIEIQFGSSTDNWTIRNNTIIGYGGYDFGTGSQLVRFGGGTGHQCYNNILICDYSDPLGSLVYHDYNIYRAVSGSPGETENNSYEYPNYWAGGNAAALADLFVDPNNYDFRLKKGCRAVNFGDPNYVPECPNDLDGNPRVSDGRIDAGCYEYVGGPPDTTHPTDPQNLTAQAVSEHQIDLSWEESSDPESGVSYYKIYRVGSQIDTSVSTSYSNTGLNSGTTYSYEVSAVNGQGLESGRSNTAQATTFSDTTPPSIVSVVASETSVEITFSESLDTISAEQTSNYSINNGEISVTAASLDTDTVTLTTSAHTEGTYTLTVKNVQDNSSNQMTETTRNYDYDNGLVSRWKFDDGSGNSVVDSSGNSNTGTLINGPTWTTGKIDGALSFDGVDDYVDIPTAGSEFNFDNDFAISAWMYSTTSNQGGYAGVVAKTGGSGEGWTMQYDGNNEVLSFQYKTSTGWAIAKTNDVIPVNQWTHVVGQISGDTAEIYVDGNLQTTTGTNSGNRVHATNTINIGREQDDNVNFTGLIDDVRVYNRALSAAEILELYGETPPVDTNAPVISNLDSSNISSSGATITWNTNEASTSQVEYGLDTNYGNSTTLDASLVTSHSVLLTGLSPTTTYHFHVISADASENESISQDNTFTTAVVTYSITASAGSRGQISPSGTTLVVSGGSQTYDITANTGYYIWDVLVDGSSVGAVSSYSFTNVTANHTIAASFAIEITASAGSDGQISPSGATQVVVGGSQTYSITANTGYHISDVLVDGSSVGAVSSYSFTNVIDNHTIAASFAIDTYSITASAGSGGTISPSGTTQVNSGSAQTYTITADIGYHITDVLVDDSSVGVVTSYSFTNVTANHTIAATFGEQDVTDPTVTNLSPDPNGLLSDLVPLNSLILLDITDSGKGVDANTVNIKVNNNVVYSGNTTNYSSSYGNCRRIGNSAAYKYIYQANEKFDFDQTITVTVDAADLAATANVMNPFSYSLITEQHSFGENKILHSGSNNENWGPLTTVCDGSGNIWIAWPQGVVGSRDIYVGKLVAGTDSFVNSGVVQVTTDSNDQGNPVLAVDGADKLYLAWQDNRQGEWDIYISTSDDWSTQTKITDPNSNQINPAIAVDSTDKVYVVWEDDQNSDKDIYIASSTNSFSTQVTTRITSSIYDQITPDIAVGYGDIADLLDDTVYVVWTDTRNTGGAPNPKYDIYGAASNNSWTNIAIVTAEESQSSPAIATEAVGSVLHLVWLDDTPGDDDIYYASTSDGLPAAPLTGSSIIDEAGTDQFSPVIATTGSTGNGLEVFACWRDERNAEAELYAVETTANGTNIYVGNDFTTDDQSQPAIGIDQYGYPYLVWINGRTDICYAGSTFIEPTALASVTAPVSTTTTVGTVPGSITNIDDVSTEILQRAYLCDIKVTISRIRNPHKPPSNNRTFLYEFGPSGTTFSEPVTITIPYNATTLVSSPSAYWYNPLTGLYSQEGITDVEVIQISGLYALRFKTTHFSMFGGGGPFGGGGGGGGGGCSMSPDSQASIVELLLPYMGLTVAMVALKLRDRRKRKARKTTKSEC